MRVILFGATGMLGQGVLRECLLDKDVESVLSVGRSETGLQHPKLLEIVQRDLFALEAIGSKLDGYGICLYCLGVSSFRMPEKDYRRLTLDLTVAIAETLLRHNPGLRFLFISGTGTDSAGSSSQMWARVKGEAENALFRMPFGAVYMFRPGFIRPLHGNLPRAAWMRAFYTLATPLFPVLRALLPKHVSTTEELGRAMLHVAKHGYGRPVLENWDFRKAR
jgi:uncharacterized protein YbjT (DUF2867 family)